MESLSKQSKRPSPLIFIESAVKQFSLTEKIVFYICYAVVAISTLVIVWNLNQSMLVSVPADGGTLIEGIVGYPRFINPVLSSSRADQDLTSLIYSGLLKSTPDGKMVNSLAKEYSISEDKLTYTFTLKDDVYFHDGRPVTTDDIEFTIKKIMDPALKSADRIRWEGVKIEKVDTKTIKFILKLPYTPFILNMTTGILPKHIWEGTNANSEQFIFSQFNTKPIGSGPYKIKKIERNAEGVPLSYRLEAFKKYSGDIPKIKNIIIKSFTNEAAMLTAYKNGEIASASSIPAEQALDLKTKGANIKTAFLPRVFGVFFNQNQSKILSNIEVREALNTALDKQDIIQKVLYGFGTKIDSPIPAGLIDSISADDTDNETPESRQAKAKEILEKAGWTLNPDGIYEKKSKNDTSVLKFTLSTSDAPELMKTAEILKDQWRKIGAEVDVKIFEPGDFNQTVLRPRKYDSVLFGEIIGTDLDLYAFWHAGERNDPGLNIALYANSKVDKALTESRTISDEQERIKQLRIVEDQIKKDLPAIFLYSPNYLYILPGEIKNFKMEKVMNPSERFTSISEWYINEDKIWKVFAK